MPNNNANIDERVVEMRIDNRQFVDGAEKTISALDKLKKALNFRGADDGLADLQSSADKLDLSGIASDVEQISSRFSTLGLVGQRVIQNLTDTVSNFITNTVKGFTIDPIMQGWSQYEEVLKSTKTILAATRNEDFSVLGYGSQIEYVNDQLERLMWYTDETSYSFQDMVANIGKFTNAGVPLEQAMIDMQGITNWAGLSGASIQEASRAMYNLSQAIAVGSVKLMDWRSIENANMATLEFKQTAIDTAVKIGTLKKVGDGLYETLKGNTVSAQNFNEALSDGWFTAQVLEQTLTYFGDFSRVLNETMQDLSFIEEGITTTDVLGWVEDIEVGKRTIEEWHDELVDTMSDPELVPSIEALQYAFQVLTDDELALGRRAFVASQEYKTLRDAIDATSDAVRTGWTKSFMTIIGDAEEAKAVWTYIGDELYDIFASAGNRRNAILKYWREYSSIDGLTGRDSLLQGLKNLYEGIRTYVDPIVEGFNRIFSWGSTKGAAKKLFDITKRFEEFTSKISLSEKAQEGMANFFETVFGSAKKALGIFKPIGSVIGSVLGYLRDFVEIFFESFAGEKGFDLDYFSSGIHALFDGIGFDVKWITAATSSVISTLTKWISSITSIWDSIKNVFTTVWDWLKTVFSGIKDSFSGIFSGEGIGLSSIIKVLGALLVFKKGSSIIGGVKDFFSAFTPIKNIASGISSFFDSLTGAIENFSKGDLSKQLRNVAISIGILTVSLLVLSTVDQTKLGKSLLVLAGGLTELVAAIGGLNLAVGKKSKNATKGLIQLSVSVLVLTVALKVLDGLNPDRLMSSLGVVAALLVMIVAFMEAINLLKINHKAIKGVLSLAIAMLVFSGVIFILGSIPYEKLKQGLVALALALAVVSVAMIAISKFGGVKALAAGIGMMFLATSLVILAAAIALFTLLDPEKIGAALMTMALALIVVGVAVAVMPATLPLIGAGLILVAVAIGLLAAIIFVLSKVDFNSVMSGLGVLTITLIVLAAAMAVMSGLVPGAIALLIVSAAFVVGAVSLVIFAAALRLLTGLPFNAIFEGLVLVAAGLVALAIGLAVMTVGIVGAVALIVAAGGLIALAFALNMLTGIDLPSMAGGLALLGASLLVLGAGGIIMTLGAVGLTAGAIAIGLMGIALIPFVYALKQLQDVSFETVVKYLLLLAGTATALGLLTPVLTPLAVAVGVFGAACLAAGEGLNLAGDGMVKISESILSIPDNVGKAFKNAAKEIANSVFEFEPSGEKVIAEINKIGTGMYNAMVAAGNDMSKALSEIVDAQTKTIVNYIPQFEVLGNNEVIGIANGIYSESSTATRAMSWLAQRMIAQYQTDFDMHSPSALMEKLSRYIPAGAACGIQNGASEAVESIGYMGSRMVTAMQGAMATIAALADEDFSISPVITPVVDMSNIENSAGSIAGMFSNNPSISERASQISRTITDAENLASNMRTLSEARSSISQDSYEINIYPSPDMDEEAIADAVLDRLSSGIIRKGVSLG